MYKFRVWAPTAWQMELYINNKRFPMQSCDGGWWEIEYPASAGDNYGYCPNGGEPFPDPQSAWQPRGINGLSRIVDHKTFRWSDKKWKGRALEDAIIYEMHIGTFSPEGTFKGAAKKLNHIVELGATVVELMPVVEFAGERGWGYDGVDLFAPHHKYGGPVGLKYFVNECHTRGLGVVIDVVYNHIGEEGNHLERFGPYITGDRTTPWGESLMLTGPGSEEVRKFVVDNAAMWIRDYHCDGLRVDAIHALRWSGAIELAKDICNVVREVGEQQGRKVFVIAEDDVNDSSVVLPGEDGGLGFDGVYANTFQRALQATLTGERTGHYAGFEGVPHLVEALHGPFVYTGAYTPYIQNKNSAVVNIDPAKFVVYLQNHDQVGNREQGERISALVSSGMLKIGAALTLLSPFTPMLFQGEEFDARSPFLFFTDRRELKNAFQVLQGRIDEFRGFGWNNEAVVDPQDLETFMRSRLTWEDLNKQEHREIFSWYRELIKFRRQTQEHRQRFDTKYTLVDPKGDWLRLVCLPIVIAVNFSEAPATIPFLSGANICLSSSKGAVIKGNMFYMPAESVIVGRVEDADNWT